MAIRLLSFIVLLLAAPAAAQVDEPEPLVVMNLAAHPDDEDGLTLAYYRHVKDAAAYSVIYTRGEGGQNEIGPELYEQLGAIRTAETERAARILGTQVRFLNFYDFGYSKFAAEAFDAWGGRDSVTARLVYLVRKLKPDVLFTNHDTLTVGDTQHGQHQAVGLSAYDAFELAADPSYHPEQLAESGVDLWQPKRLFLRMWRWSTSDGDPDVKVPVGDVVPGRDVSAADLAVEAAAKHRSQGFDKFAPRFRRDTTYFQLLRAAPGVAPLPDDATDLAVGLAPNAHAANASLATLIDSGRITASLPGDADLQPDVAIALPGDEVPIRWTRELTFHASTGQPSPVEIVFSGAVDTTVTVLPGAAPAAVLRIPNDATPTLPKDARQYDRFLSTPPIQYAVRVPGDADALYAAGHLPLEIAPPLAIEPAAQVIRLRPGANAVPVRVLVYSPEADSVEVAVSTRAPDSATPIYTLATRTFPVSQTGLIADTVAVTLGQAQLGVGTHTLTLSAVPLYGTPNGARQRGPATSTTQPARALPPIRIPDGLRVGFVESYDDATASALRDLGATVVPLDSAALAEGAFDGLHTIVVDIRAYLVREDLRAHNDQLLDWVRDGGHLVVGYQKTFEWNPQHADPFDPEQKNPAGFAPYPLTLGRDRVTYEDAPVTLLDPDHVLFRTPNEITDADWDDWVQERGLYFPAEYDDRYTELFAMHDPGEAPLRSSTLIAEVGEGTYVYTALGWYRQLAAYNPGATRLFANLVSLPLVDGR